MIDAAPAYVPLPELPPAFSIARTGADDPFRIRRSCTSESGEIVVCGRRGAGLGLELLPDLWRDAPRDPDLPVGTDLAPGLRLGANVTQTLRPDGWVDQRVMIGLRSRF